VEIPAETGIVWSAEGLVTYLEPFPIESLYFLAKVMVNIGGASLTVLDKVPLCKQARTVL
jgi:O-methyltransferase involved in polyketide biosynthesis